MLDGVQTTAERAAIEYQIDRKVINVSKQYTAASGSAVDVLENVPAVTVDIEGNVTLRGSSSFTVLIDGRPSVLDANDALRQIPAAASRTSKSSPIHLPNTTPRARLELSILFRKRTASTALMA